VKALEDRTEQLQTENSELKAKLSTVEDQLKKQQAQIDELKKLIDKK
jgi:chaperonin cofactor prefoldin